MTAIPKDSVIRLTAVDMTIETTLMQALKDRASIPHGGRFSPELISLEQLSSLLWAANGFNRDSLRTAPSAINAQDIDIYVCFDFGAYLYDAHENILTRVTEKDLRAEVAGFQEEWAHCPMFLVMVSDFSRFFRGDDATRLTMATCDASYVSANIGLYCAAANLATRPRMSADWDKLAVALNLKESQHGILNNPVGFAANGK